MAKVDEKLMFKVIEFNKSAKKIIVSHSRVYEDEKKRSGGVLTDDGNVIYIDPYLNLFDPVNAALQHGYAVKKE